MALEGTAAWMEDQVVDDVNANRIWLHDSPLTHPWVPIDSSKGMSECGAWIFGDSSARRRGRRLSFVGAERRRVWELAADAPPGIPNLFSAQAVGKALASRHRSLPSALVGFGVWNLAPGAFYDEGAAYPTAPVNRHHRVSREPPDRGLEHAPHQPFEHGRGVVPAGFGIAGWASLRLTLDAPARRTGSAARLLLFLRSGSLRVVPVVLDRNGDADLVVPFGTSQVRRVVLVYANAGTEASPLLDR